METRTIRISLAVVVVAALVIFGLVKLFGGGDNSNDNGKPQGLSESELISKASSFGHPAYWVGPQPGTSEYELTQTSDGRVYVRYLTQGAPVGEQVPAF